MNYYMISLKKVILIGGIHGNERIGSNVIIHLTKYLLENIIYNETIQYYLRNRLILFYPMSNPYGYYHNIRVYFEFSNKFYKFFRKKKKTVGSLLIQIEISLII